MPLELASLKPVERMIQILHPATSEEIGVTVSLISLSDPRMSKVKRMIQDNRMKLEARGKNFKSDEVEENRTTLCFNAMTGWSWGKEAVFNGKAPEFNPNVVTEVFRELPWFRDQIEEALSDEKSFFTS